MHAVVEFTACLQLPWGIEGGALARRAAKALGHLLRGGAGPSRHGLLLGPCSPQFPTSPEAPGASATTHVPLTALLSRLDAPGLLLLLTAFLCERRMLLLSQSPSVAASCVLALQQLMRPLQWCHTCVPYLPLHLSTHISAPQPLIMGASPAHLLSLTQELGPSACGPLLLVDLDTGSMHSTRDAKPLPDLSSQAGDGSIRAHMPRAAAAAQDNTTHLHAAAGRFALAHTAGSSARAAAKSLASVLPGPISPGAAPLPGKPPPRAGAAMPSAALSTLSSQWSSAMQNIVSSARAASSFSLIVPENKAVDSLTASHATLHLIGALAPGSHSRQQHEEVQDASLDLLGMNHGTVSAQTGHDGTGSGSASGDSPPIGSMPFTGGLPSICRVPSITGSFMEATRPLLTSASKVTPAVFSEGAASAPAQASSTAPAASSSSYFNKLGRKLKHTIASSSLGQAVGREVRHIRSDAPSQADMWRPHDCLLRQGGESLGERLARELQDAYAKARSVGHFDEHQVRGSVLAFLALLLSSAHTAVAPSPSKGGALEWRPEQFSESVMDARLRPLVSEMAGSQILCSLALGMYVANAGMVPDSVDSSSHHPQLHKQGYHTDEQGRILYLTTLLAGQELLRDHAWRAALGSDTALHSCTVAQYTFGDVRRRVVAALKSAAAKGRALGMQQLLLSCSAAADEVSTPQSVSAALLLTHLRLLGRFSRELAPLGLKAAAADWALWRPRHCSWTTDEVVTATNVGGASSSGPDGDFGDAKGLIDLLLAATSDSTPSNHEPRQLNQLVALLSYSTAARAAIIGVALLRLSDCAASKHCFVTAGGGPSADAIRHGAVPFNVSRLQWRWASWKHGLLAANLLLCMLLHGAPAARASVALLLPLLHALLQPTLGNLAGAAYSLGNLGGTIEGADVATAASMARLRRSTARSIAAKVAFGLSGGRAATSTFAADGLGSGQSLLGANSSADGAWCGEPLPSAAASDGGLPAPVKQLLQEHHSNDPAVALTARALNVKAGLELGHAAGLGVHPSHLQQLTAGKAKQGVATLKASLRLILKLLTDSRAWYRTRLAAQQAGSLLPTHNGEGVLSGAAVADDSAVLQTQLSRFATSCHSLYLPAPLPAMVDPTACLNVVTHGQRVLHPWDLDFAQLRGQALLAKRAARVPLHAFHALPRVLVHAQDGAEPQSPGASGDSSPQAGVLPVSDAMSKLHSMFMPVGWNSRSHPQAMKCASQRSPSYVKSIIATHAASQAITVQLGGGAIPGTVPLQACAHGLGGTGRSTLRHRRARSIAQGPLLPQESEISDFDLFDQPATMAPARAPQHAAHPVAAPAASALAPQAPPPNDDAWGSDLIAFD